MPEFVHDLNPVVRGVGWRPSFSALTALELEHGLCEDYLMKDDD